MIELKEKTDATPLCPHCCESVDELWYQEVSSFFGRRYVYFCAKCRKTLGVSHRKGFLMG